MIDFFEIATEHRAIPSLPSKAVVDDPCADGSSPVSVRVVTKVRSNTFPVIGMQCIQLRSQSSENKNNVRNASSGSVSSNAIGFEFDPDIWLHGVP
jgi:hypothetical protein